MTTTARSAVFYTEHPERFTQAERDRGDLRQAPGPNGETGWVTIPVNGLTPDCEPVAGTCACGRSAV